MSIDWSAFTPWQALSGGILIGLASVVLVLWNGRIAGISGILGGLLIRVEGDNAWRLAFILGLLAAPWLWAALSPRQPAAKQFLTRLALGVGATGRGRSAGGLRDAARQRLYQWPWRMRSCPVFAALAGCGIDLHERWHGDRIHDAPRNGGVK